MPNDVSRDTCQLGSTQFHTTQTILTHALCAVIWQSATCAVGRDESSCIYECYFPLNSLFQFGNKVDERKYTIMTGKSKAFTKEEELLLQDFSRNVSTKSSALFYGNALIVSAIPICE